MGASYIPMSTSVGWRAGIYVVLPIVAEATAAPCEAAWSAEVPGRAPRAEGEPIMDDVTAAPGNAARSAELPGSATGGQVKLVMAGATAAPSEAARSAELPISTPGGEVEPGAGGGRGLLSERRCRLYSDTERLFEGPMATEDGSGSGGTVITYVSGSYRNDSATPLRGRRREHDVTPRRAHRNARLARNCTSPHLPHRYAPEGRNCCASPHLAGLQSAPLGAFEDRKIQVAWAAAQF